ncbi:MAG: EI24 domain-containing protein [Oligoflexia bacterium]|nr:EI24 domain-containing protein [Oligoflexia bacterium]
MKKMKKINDVFKISLDLIKRDRSLQILLLFPFLIGILLYIFFAIMAFKVGIPYINELLLKQWAFLNSWAQWISYILITLTALLLIVFCNFTFVIIVSILSSPFNQMISDKIEFSLNKTISSDSTNSFFSSFVFGTFNDLKRISFVIFASIILLIIGFIPVLTPISICMSALLISYQFLDYNWSRHKLGIFSSLHEVRNNLFYYLVIGFLFLFLFSIPIINLLTLPFAVVFYSVYWVKYKC